MLPRPTFKGLQSLAALCVIGRWRGGMPCHHVFRAGKGAQRPSNGCRGNCMPSPLYLFSCAHLAHGAHAFQALQALYDLRLFVAAAREAGAAKAQAAAAAGGPEQAAAQRDRCPPCRCES